MIARFCIVLSSCSDCVFGIHCKYRIYYYLIGVHLYKFYTCLGINKTRLNQVKFLVHCELAVLKRWAACGIN